MPLSVHPFAFRSIRDDRGVFGEMGMHHAELNMEHAVRDHSAIGAKVLPGRNETYAFVKAHSEGTDCLPGMCLFVERWLTHVRLCPGCRSDVLVFAIGRVYPVSRHTSQEASCNVG